jgi:hypothetical protein
VRSTPKAVRSIDWLGGMGARCCCSGVIGAAAVAASLREAAPRLRTGRTTHTASCRRARREGNDEQATPAVQRPHSLRAMESGDRPCT